MPLVKGQGMATITIALPYQCFKELKQDSGVWNNVKIGIELLTISFIKGIINLTYKSIWMEVIMTILSFIKSVLLTYPVTLYP